MRTVLILALLGLILPIGVRSHAAVADDTSGREGAVGRVRPVPGMLLRPFDPPAAPWSAGHRGVDLAGTPGDAVRAALAGEVRFSGIVAGIGWVTVDHGGGLATTYGPLTQRLPAGTDVAAGVVIGRLDATHLDWGARFDGGYIDPLSLLRRWRPTLVGMGEQRLL